jgi:hypothetical protein
VEYAHYDQPTGGPSTPESGRVESTRSLIPDGVRSVLDCGCGWGHLGNLICRDYAVVGCDGAMTRLSACRFPVVRCGLEALPFADHCADLVVCSEVLEHILPTQYQVVCRELERVAREWLLVTVPNREPLDAFRQQCPHCGTIFHDAWHLRSYDEELLARSFRDFAPRRWIHMGHKQRLDRVLRIRLRNRLLGYPRLAKNRRCPLCRQWGTPTGEFESRAKAGRRPDRPRWVSALRRSALRLVPGRSRWLGCLLQRV